VRSRLNSLVLSLLVRLLGPFVPAPREDLGEALFHLVSRLTHIVNEDLLTQRSEGVGKQILLVWRSDSSYVAWHLPKSIIRFKEAAVARLHEVARLELGALGIGYYKPLEVFEFISRTHNTRGHFLSHLNACELRCNLDRATECQDFYNSTHGKWACHCEIPSNLLKVREIYGKYFV
jgi:hypothetical protein